MFASSQGYTDLNSRSPDIMSARLLQSQAMKCREQFISRKSQECIIERSSRSLGLSRFASELVGTTSTTRFTLQLRHPA